MTGFVIATIRRTSSTLGAGGAAASARPPECLCPPGSPPKWLGPAVLRHLDRRTSALIGEWLVVEARDDVQVRV